MGRFLRCFILIPIFLAACDGTGPDTPSLDGSWSGEMSTSIASATWTLSINDNNGSLSGNWSIANQAAGVSWSGSFTGTYDHPAANFRANLTIEGQAGTGRYDATVSDSRETMTGAVQVGVQGQLVATGSLTLTKQ